MDKLELLKKWEDQYNKLDELTKSVELIFGQNESVFFDALWRHFDFTTDLLALLIGDRNGWLDWYRGENNFGEKQLSAKGVGSKKFKKVKNLKDLLRFIEADQPDNK